ncbi:MAG: DUF1570 domain-containing protein [Pirellulales bacterium]
MAASAAARQPQPTDVLTFRLGEDIRTVAGKILTRALDGSVLHLGRDGQIWPVKRRDLISLKRNAAPFRPMSADELAGRLRSEFGEDFEIYQTPHYLICYSTSLDYARWCGHLFEQLYRSFMQYWRNRGFAVQEPEFPLVAVVFDHRFNYIEYGREEAGARISRVVGFYSPQTNRIALYNPLAQTRRARLPRRMTRRQRNQTFARVTGSLNVATIIHEATHQIAFNAGFHQRYADNPLWLVEGMAIYFETPDLNSDTGWEHMGELNARRLDHFRRYSYRRPDDALVDLITDDERFRNPQTVQDAYAEAWALNYFLIRARPDQYHAYLRILNDKPPMMDDTPAKRLEDFRSTFGYDLKALDADFVRYMKQFF